MLVSALWLACTPGAPDAEYVPGRWTPAAGRLEWTGPTGIATLEVDDGPDGAWREVASMGVPSGRSSLPVALVPAGRWHWRLTVENDHWVVERTGVFEIPDAPGLGASVLDAVDPARSAFAAGGYWVGYQFGYRWNSDDAIPIVLDGEGRVVWWAPPDPDGGLAMRVEPGLDRGSILVLEDFEDGSQRVVHRYSLDGTTRTTTPTPDASHDFAEGADGITYIAYQWSSDEPIPGQPAPAVADVVTTVPEGGGEPLLGWSFLDDFPQDPWYACDHAGYDQFVPDSAEWTHTNTVLRSPMDDAWLLGVRHLDAIVAVEGHTRLWQVGGDDATLPGVELHHPHLSEAWLDEDGVLHLLVFDNRNHLPTPIVSRVVEIAVHDEDAEVIWELVDPEGRFTGFLGGANRLPGAHTLVSWSPHGELVEYTPDGEMVWRWTLDAMLGRGAFVELEPLAVSR